MCFTRTASRFQPPGLLGHFFGGEFFTHPLVVVMEFEIGHRNPVFFHQPGVQGMRCCCCCFFSYLPCLAQFWCCLFQWWSVGYPKGGHSRWCDRNRKDLGIETMLDIQIFFWLSRRPTYPNFSAYWCSRKDLYIWVFHAPTLRLLESLVGAIRRQLQFFTNAEVLMVMADPRIDDFHR